MGHVPEERLAGNFEKIKIPNLRLQSVKNQGVDSGGWFMEFRAIAKKSWDKLRPMS